MSSVEEDEKNILAKEIKSWNGFEYSLREPNAILLQNVERMSGK